MKLSKKCARLWLSAILLVALLPACISDPMNGEPAQEGLLPFHSATFDHMPTQTEIDQELMRFLSSEQGKGHHEEVNPGSNIFPSPGYKLVTLTVKTGGNSGDGMDSANRAYFHGVWLATSGSLPSYSERFVLDVPGRDDLNRGSTNIFFYTLRLASYVSGATADVFQRGRVGNTSTDRWHCEYVFVDEKNYLGTSRGQNLYYNGSFESTGSIESWDQFATNVNPLYIGG